MKRYLSILPVILLLAACGKKAVSPDRLAASLDSIVVYVNKPVSVSDTFEQCLGRDSEVLMNIPYVHIKGNDSAAARINKAMAESSFTTGWFQLGAGDTSQEQIKKRLTEAATSLIDAYGGPVLHYTYGKEKLLVNEKGVIAFQMIVLSDLCGVAFPVMNKEFLSFDLATGKMILIPEQFPEDFPATVEKLINTGKAKVDIQLSSAITPSRLATFIRENFTEDLAFCALPDRLLIYCNSLPDNPASHAEVVIPKEELLPLLLPESPLQRLWK